MFGKTFAMESINFFSRWSRDIREYYRTLIWASVLMWASALSLFCYISLLDLLIWNTFFVNLFRMSSHLLNLKSEGQTKYPSAWIFFFCFLATAFPTSYRMKTVCSFWVCSEAQRWCMLIQPRIHCFFSNVEQLNGEESR